MRVWTGTLVALLVAFVLSLVLGAVSLEPERAFYELLSGSGVVYHFRLPRFLVAVMAGFNLALAGAVLQSVMRNPLASPDLVGITTGGGVAVVGAILLGWQFHSTSLPIIGFLGAALAGALVYRLGRGGGRERLILCGVALASLGQAFITLLLVSFAPSAAEAMIWLKGSLYSRGWEHVWMLAPWTVVGALVAFLASHQMNALLLGESTLLALGMKVGRVRAYLIALAVLLAGSAVAIVGTVGFVGLLVPHAARMLVGTDHRRFLPLAGLMGGTFLSCSDTIGRIVSPPLEIPAGLVTALVGAPYFVYLLVQRKVNW